MFCIHLNGKSQLIIATCVMLSILTGCSLSQKVNGDISKWTVTDPNLVGLELTSNPDSSKRFNYQAEFHSNETNTLSFWGREYAILKVPVVKGTINDKTYPVVFDTGNSIQATLIEDIHVRENNLPVFLFDNNKPSSGGMAMVKEFRVGALYGENYPCRMWGHHTQVKLFGLPVGRSRHIIIPLALMAKFNYFKFDQINDKVCFSAYHSFKPKTFEWISFPFHIIDNQILIDIEIENIEMVLLFDTGAGHQLELQEELVSRLYKKRPEWESIRKKTAKVFSPYSEGEQKGNYFKAPLLKLDEQIVKDVQVIFDTRSFNKTLYQGIMGFELFEDTMMCLDFENNLIWVKKAGKFK